MWSSEASIGSWSIIPSLLPSLARFSSSGKYIWIFLFLLVWSQPLRTCSDFSPAFILYYQIATKFKWALQVSNYLLTEKQQPVKATQSGQVINCHFISLHLLMLWEGLSSFVLPSTVALLIRGHYKHLQTESWSALTKFFRGHSKNVLKYLMIDELSILKCLIMNALNN